MANKYLSKLRGLEGAVIPDAESDPRMNCLRSPMPSVNWAFAMPGGGLPFGYAALLFGPPKGGKSFLINGIIGQLHRDDPEAIALTYNTELRAKIQANSNQLKLWGIDGDRFQAFDTNQPENIFDKIETDIAKMCEDGAKIRLINIDSITGVMGRRMMTAESILNQQIGDQALTVQDGLKRILPTIRKYNIALILSAHVRAEMDQAEQMRGNKVKMATAWAVKHLAEFFCYVEPIRNKDSKVSLLGEEFTDPEIVDFLGKAQKTGHKLRFTVKESSLGISGRTAEFTIDYDKGVINTYEEVFGLAKNYGIIQRPNNTMYEYAGKQYRGLPAILVAIRDDQSLYNELLTAVIAKDAIK